VTEEMFGAGHRRDAVTRIERGAWTSQECRDRRHGRLRRLFGL